MPTDIVLTPITTNTTTDAPVDSIGTGWVVSLSGATSGTTTLQKKLPNGTIIDVTDNAGTAISTTSYPVTLKAEIGAGARLVILTETLVGTLDVALNPLKSEK